MVEHSLAKAEVEGSSPSFRSRRSLKCLALVGIGGRTAFLLAYYLIITTSLKWLLYGWNKGDYLASCLRALILYINKVRLIAGLKTLLKVSIMDCLKKRAFRILSFFSSWLSSFTW
jgi:hypothetical protein